MSSAGLVIAPIETRTGFFTCFSIKCATDFSIVAEKNSVCRVVGMVFRIRLSAGKKPMSSMRSASSSTSTSTPPRFTSLRSRKSHRRPGVAITICAPRRMA